MSTLKQEDSHNIRHISDFHFPLTYKGRYRMRHAVYICMLDDLFRARIRYLCPKKKDILSLRKI